MKIFSIPFFLMLMLVNVNAAELTPAADLDYTSPLPVTAHLHRLVARHEVGKATLKDVAFSIEVIFDNALHSGETLKASSIVEFLRSEDILSELVVSLRLKLFKSMSRHAFTQPHMLGAFQPSCG